MEIRTEVPMYGTPEAHQMPSTGSRYGHSVVISFPALLSTQLSVQLSVKTKTPEFEKRKVIHVVRYGSQYRLSVDLTLSKIVGTPLNMCACV